MKTDPLVSICIPTFNRADMVGKAIESADKASSLILPTYILSTTLYKACIDIPIIAGKANLNIRGIMGSVPIRLELTLFKKPPTYSFFILIVYILLRRF